MHEPCSQDDFPSVLLCQIISLAYRLATLLLQPKLRLDFAAHVLSKRCSGSMLATWSIVVSVYWLMHHVMLAPGTPLYYR